jgi:hypothetical protein
MPKPPKFHRLLANRAGSTLIGAIVALVLIAMGAASLSKLLSSFSRGQRNVASLGDKNTIRNLIANSIDCSKTFVSAGIDPRSPGGNCTSTSSNPAGPFFLLRRQTLDGSTRFFSDTSSTAQDTSVNGTVFANAHLRASCSSSEQSLIVQLIPGPPTTTTPDYSGAITLFSGNTMPLCFSSYVSLPTARPFTNPVNPYDVDGDNYVTTRDLGILQSEKARNGTYPLTGATGKPPFFDVAGAPSGALYTTGDSVFNDNDINALTNCIVGKTDSVDDDADGILYPNDPDARHRCRSPWTNNNPRRHKFDVDDDGYVVPMDVVTIINFLNSVPNSVSWVRDTSGTYPSGTFRAPLPLGDFFSLVAVPPTVQPFRDANADYHIDERDPNSIIACINSSGGWSGLDIGHPCPN